MAKRIWKMTKELDSAVAARFLVANVLTHFRSMGDVDRDRLAACVAAFFHHRAGKGEHPSQADLGGDIFWHILCSRALQQPKVELSRWCITITTPSGTRISMWGLLGQLTESFKMEIDFGEEGVPMSHVERIQNGSSFQGYFRTFPTPESSDADEE